MNNRTRHIGLDLLRFIAVFLVIGRHLKTCPDKTNRIFHYVTQIWGCGGWMGVDLFFVLSGFLISSLLFREAQSSGKIDVKRFLIRRGFKIYPGFWFLLGLTLIAYKLTSIPIPIDKVMAELLFIQNYAAGIYIHTWSLAIEEHFYLAIACILFLFARMKPADEDPFQWIPTIFLVLAIICLSLRFVTSYLPIHYNWHFAGTHARIDSLMFGVLISWLWNYKNLSDRINNIPPWFFVVLGIGLLSPTFFIEFSVTWWIPVFGAVLVYVGSGLLLLGFLHLPSTNSKVLNCLALFGAYSYSVYLWHFLVSLSSEKILLLKLPVGWAYLLYLLTYVLVSFILGACVARLIEYPVLLLRDRFFPSQSRPLRSDKSPA